MPNSLLLGQTANAPREVVTTIISTDDYAECHVFFH